MSSQDTSALTKRSGHTSLMAPPPVPRRIKRPAVVLDEDTYTNSIAHIIRRDFFPGLAETDAQREYLNALDSRDNTWIREAGQRLTDVMMPVPGGKRQRVGKDRGFGSVHEGAMGQTPIGKSGETPVWAADTPRTIRGGDTEEDPEKRDKKTKPEVDLSLSLSAFQARYISEDQESFSQLIDAQNAKRFARTEWMRSGNRFASKQRLAQQRLLASKAEQGASQEVALRPSQNLDDRPAAPTMHKHTAFNTLMFNPESVEDWAPTRSQLAESASAAPPKVTLYHNTRLPTTDSSTETNDRPSSPTMSAVRDAIREQPRLSQSEGGYTGSETPRVNGYAFVDAIAPHPGDESDDEAPRDLLEKFDIRANPSSFTIHDSQRREKLHHKMVEQIGSKKSFVSSTSDSVSKNRTGFLGNETPRFLSAPTARPGALGKTPGGKNMGNLTPAAQRLFQKVGGGTPRVRHSEGFGQNAKEGDWTPTPRVKRRL